MALNLSALVGSEGRNKVVPSDLQDKALQNLNSLFNTTDLNALISQQNFDAIAAAIGSLQQSNTNTGGADILQDTHANRVANFPASSYPTGELFFETDTKVLLINTQISGVNAWVPKLASPIEDTNAHVSNYYAPYYPDGMLYTANDLPNRPSYYSAAGGGGCTVSGGTAVLRTSGANFDTRWVGYPIVVAGVTVVIAAVSGVSSLTLASPVTNGATGWSLPSLSWVSTDQIIVGTHATRLTTDPTKQTVGTLFLESDRSYVVYIIIANGTLGANAWNYASGVYVDVWANRPTLTAFDAGFLFSSEDFYFTERWTGSAWTYKEGEGEGSASQMLSLGLGASEAGVLWAETTFSHRFLWNGTGWTFGPGDPGSGYTVVTAGSSPLGGLWYAANGSSYTVMQPNGTTTSVASPVVTNGWMRG